MARPQLPIGTHGENSYHVARSGSHIARTFYRDADGVTWQGATDRPDAGGSPEQPPVLAAGAAAQLGRLGPVSGLLVPGGCRPVADGVVQAADVGDLSPNTAQLYMLQLRNHVLPALGSLRLREIGVGRLDDFLRRLQRSSGVATAKTCRTVVSGVMGLAVRHEAVQYNPARDVSRIRGGRRRVPRALTRDERDRWLAALDADPQAARKDLPDLTRWMLATGVRIGEALAVSWSEVDLDARSVEIDWKLVRIKGEELRRVPRVKDDSDRTLPLPQFAVDMLRRRNQGPASMIHCSLTRSAAGATPATHHET
jgi:hypothetical protein